MRLSSFDLLESREVKEMQKFISKSCYFLDGFVLVVRRHELIVTELHADAGGAPGHGPHLPAVPSQLRQRNLSTDHTALGTLHSVTSSSP